MNYLTDKIRLLIQQEKYLEAAQKLNEIFLSGLPQIAQQCKRMEERIRRDYHPEKPEAGKKFNPASTLLTFLEFLEKNHADQLRFLSHLELAKQNFRQGEWPEAKLNFELALQLHKTEYAIAAKEISNQSARCDEALVFNQYIETGNTFFASKSWENASFSYQAALKMIKADFHYDTTELQKALNLCKKGFHFDKNLDLARGYESQRIWEKAKLAYFRAIELYDPAFEADKAELEQALVYCEEKDQHKKAGDKKTVPFIGVLNVSLLVGIVVFTIYFIGKTGYKSQIHPPANTAPSTLVADTTVVPAYPKGLQPVAILPFCNEAKDYSLSAKIYSDAFSAIKTSGNQQIHLLSETQVSAVIQKLKLANADFCEEEKAVHLAQNLGAEVILMGQLIRLPDNQIRIVCQLFHIPTREYSREIVLTDRDLSRLRRNLALEIQQVFY
ncbi:MAG: hypothetical protein R3C61_03590 [Bacteroidia bacterium]